VHPVTTPPEQFYLTIVREYSEVSISTPNEHFARVCYETLCIRSPRSGIVYSLVVSERHATRSTRHLSLSAAQLIARVKASLVIVACPLS
jgi:hypothetical protein